MVSAASIGAGVGLVATSQRIALAQRQQPLLPHNGNHQDTLNFSSPSPLIFHSAFGLLQQWPNTFFTNGHTIAPCSIAKNTNLYHARGDSSFPPSPEWFAFDPAMSYFIAGAMSDSHMLTYRTTRDVRCIYFDGTSASLMADGSMFSQMLLLHNTSAGLDDHSGFPGPPGSANGSYGRPICDPGLDYGNENCTLWNPLQAEYERATGLCNFIREKNLGGLGWGYEAIVRMNAGFEVIWWVYGPWPWYMTDNYPLQRRCNFSSPSARMVSWLNTSSPPLDGVGVSQRPWTPSGNRDHDRDPDPYPPSLPLRAPTYGGGPPQWPGADSPFRSYSLYDWFHIATQRYGFVGGVPGRGESRVLLDSCGLFTFYDPALENQEHARVAQEARAYNLTAEGHWRPDPDAVDRDRALTALRRRRRLQIPRNVSVEDGHFVRLEVEARLRAALDPESAPCSGIDWSISTQEILAFYANPLQRLLLLTSTERLVALNSSETRSEIAQSRSVLHALWLPFYEYPIAVEEPELAFDIQVAQSTAALHRCRSQSKLSDLDQLSPSEHVTYGALIEVLEALCSTLLPVFLGTERIWLSNFNNASADLPSKDSRIFKEVTAALQRQHQVVEELMAWLGWADQWVACTPGCGLGETCYIPIWPTMGLPDRNRGDRRRNASEHEHAAPPQRENGTGWGMDGMSKFLWEPTCVDAEHYPPV